MGVGVGPGTRVGVGRGVKVGHGVHVGQTTPFPVCKTMGVPGAHSVSTTVGSGPVGIGSIVAVARGVTMGETSAVVAGGVAIGDNGALLCGVLCGGVSGLQPISSTASNTHPNSIIPRNDFLENMDTLLGQRDGQSSTTHVQSERRFSGADKTMGFGDLRRVYNEAGGFVESNFT